MRESWTSRESPAHTLTRLTCRGSIGTFHAAGSTNGGLSGAWRANENETHSPPASRMIQRRPWKRQVSPAQRRMHDTQRGILLLLYRVAMHRAFWNSGTSISMPMLRAFDPKLEVLDTEFETLDAAFRTLGAAFGTLDDAFGTLRVMFVTFGAARGAFDVSLVDARCQ
jgi:hypothetical protein